MSKQQNVIALKAIAAIAESAAMKEQNNAHWPGDLQSVLTELRKHLGDIKT